MNKVQTQTFGDRHLRPLAGLSRPSGERRRMRITASHAVAETMSGQHTLWMLANLLARQFGVVAEVEIVLPRVPVHPQVAFFGHRNTLPESIAEVIRLVAEESVRAIVVERGTLVDIEVVVGAMGTQSLPALQRIGVAGEGWHVFVGKPESVPRVDSNDGSSLGPYFAACIAAGEVFKRFCGLQPGKGRLVEALGLSLWDFQEYLNWTDAPAGPCPERLDLPPAYLIGAGAVGQAAAAALAAWGAPHGHLTVIDKEAVDATNINRYPLATLADIGVMKAQLLADRLRGRSLGIHAYNKGWPQYALDPEAKAIQREDLHAAEAAYRYGLVLSCVDKNIPRHAIQNYWPEYLLGASTNGLGIAVASYDMRSEFECLKCNNPPEQKGPPVEQVAEQLRCLPPEERRSRAESCGANWRAVEEYIADPRCGMIGEREVEKFTAGNPDWSVGFVSAASGTLLAAQLVKFALLGRGAFPAAEGNTLRFNFLNPGPRRSMHRRNPSCDCSAKGRCSYDSLWPLPSA